MGYAENNNELARDIRQYELVTQSRFFPPNVLDKIWLLIVRLSFRVWQRNESRAECHTPYPPASLKPKS